MSDTETLSCEEAIRRLASYLDGELESGSAVELEEHLDRCRSCYSRHEFEDGLKERVAGLGEESPRPEFQERIRGLVSRFSRAGSPRPSRPAVEDDNNERRDDSWS